MNSFEETERRPIVDRVLRDVEIVTVEADGGRATRGRDFRDLKSIFRPVDEEQWGKLQDLQADLDALELLYRRPEWSGASDAPLLVIRQCRANLTAARECIERRTKIRRRFQENHTLYWRLIHRIEADLLSIVPIPRLSVKAAEILGDFTRNIVDSKEKEMWIGDGGGRLPKALERIDHAVIDERQMPCSTLVGERDTFRHALGMLNRYSDRSYQQLNFALLMRCYCAVFLTALWLAAWCAYQWRGASARGDVIALSILMVILGSIGAYLALIVSEEPQLSTHGPTRRHIWYSLFVRPTLGAFAAAFLLLVAQSNLFTGGASRQGEAPPGPEAAAHPTAPEEQPLMQVRLPPLKVAEPKERLPESTFAVYAVLALVFGYGAQRILGGMMDDVLDRFYKRADKKTANPADPHVTN